MILTQAETVELGRQILAFSNAEGCAVWLEGHDTDNFRFASRGGATNGTIGGARLTVTSSFGQRQGRATTNLLDEPALRDVVARSEAAARSAPENIEVMPPLGPQNYGASAAYFDSTAALKGDALTSLLEPAVSSAKRAGLDLAAFVQAGRSWRAFASGGGAVGYDRATGIQLTVSARNARSTWSGWAGTHQNDASRLDVAAIVQSGIEKASAEPDPVALDPGKYVVLLEPPVVGQMIADMMGHFGARSADEGRSFLARKGGGNRLGERLFDERVDIRSDPADAAAPGFALSNDGLPNRPVTWVEDGVVKNLIWTRYWAKKTGVEPIAYPRFFFMRGGSDAVADMLRDVKRGVLVTRLWYVRMVDPRPLLLTGLTRDGTFLIENGAVTRPVANFRFNESPLAVLKNILAIGPSQRTYFAEAGSTAISVPPLLVKDFTFSSVAPGI
jgi:predicted Zn-dependent protease